MTPAQKKKIKKEKEASQGEKKLKKKLEALAFAALTALGAGLGQGAVEALKPPPSAVPTQSTPINNEKRTDQWTFPTPQKDLPSGDEPKQRLRFTYVNNKGEEQTVYTWVSMRGLVTSTYKIPYTGKPIINVPVEGAEHIQINAQFHPSSPVINVSVPKKDIAEHIATLAHPSLSAKDLESVTHINIAPEVNPEKTSKV